MAEDTKQSLFNAGIAKLERIHFQKILLHNAHIEHSYVTVADILFNIRSELNEWFTEDERKLGNDFEQQVREVLKQSRHAQVYIINPFIDYERWLNDKEHKYGLSMPDKPESTATQV